MNEQQVNKKQNKKQPTKEQVYGKFCKKVYADTEYYETGKYGMIEELLALFNIPTNGFEHSSKQVHDANLDLLQSFIHNEADDKQLDLIWKLSEPGVEIKM